MAFAQGELTSGGGGMQVNYVQRVKTGKKSSDRRCMIHS